MFAWNIYIFYRERYKENDRKKGQEKWNAILLFSYNRILRCLLIILNDALLWGLFLLKKCFSSNALIKLLLWWRKSFRLCSPFFSVTRKTRAVSPESQHNYLLLRDIRSIRRICCCWKYKENKRQAIASKSTYCNMYYIRINTLHVLPMRIFFNDKHTYSVLSINRLIYLLKRLTKIWNIHNYDSCKQLN